MASRIYWGLRMVEEEGRVAGDRQWAAEVAIRSYLHWACIRRIVSASRGVRNVVNELQ